MYIFTKFCKVSNQSSKNITQSMKSPLYLQQSQNLNTNIEPEKDKNLNKTKDI